MTQLGEYCIICALLCLFPWVVTLMVHFSTLHFLVPPIFIIFSSDFPVPLERWSYWTGIPGWQRYSSVSTHKHWHKHILIFFHPVLVQVFSLHVQKLPLPSLSGVCSFLLFLPLSSLFDILTDPNGHQICGGQMSCSPGAVWWAVGKRKRKKKKKERMLMTRWPLGIQSYPDSHLSPKRNTPVWYEKLFCTGTLPAALALFTPAFCTVMTSLPHTDSDTSWSLSTLTVFSSLPLV